MGLVLLHCWCHWLCMSAQGVCLRGVCHAVGLPSGYVSLFHIQHLVSLRGLGPDVPNYQDADPPGSMYLIVAVASCRSLPDTSSV